MFKCMIIDDDKLIVNDLIHIVDWKSLGVEIAAVAYNGKQGLLKYGQSIPAVIFTDIRMPFVDGLEMIRAVRARDSWVRFIVLTAYSEFSYVKEALELGASGYILKNQISRDVIETTLATVKAELFEQSKMTVLTIESVIRSFLDGDRLNPSDTTRYLERAFEVYKAGQFEWSLQELRDIVEKLFGQEYVQNEKKDMYKPPLAESFALFEWIKDRLKQIARWAQEEKRQISPMISRARSFVDENYNKKDLNIKMISDFLALSPSWLSVRFRKETGQTINEYITDARIREATRLIKQGRYRLYEIAEMVGYGSSRYFSKVFLQKTGYSPHSFGKAWSQC